MKHLIRAAPFAIGLLSAVPAGYAQVPPAVPALPDAERRVQYSISAATGPYAISFALYGTGTDYGTWIEVWLNGVRLTPVTDFTVTLTSGTLATSARPLTNAQVTLVAASTGTLQIVGAERPRRLSQFNENAGVSARNLNVAITDLVVQNRETWDKINDVTGRGLFSQPGVTLGPLPLPAACASAFLGFDSTGLTPRCLGIGTPGSGNVVGESPTVIGNFAVWDNTTGSLLKDGGGALPAAAYRMVSLVEFGGDPTGATNSTAALNAAIAASSYIYSCGTFLIDPSVIIKSGVHFQGCGQGRAVWFNTASSGTADFITVGNNAGISDPNNNGSNVTFSEMSFYHLNGSTGGACLRFKGAINFDVNRFQCYSGGTYGAGGDYGIHIDGDSFALGHTSTGRVRNSFLNGRRNKDGILVDGFWQTVSLIDNEVTGGPQSNSYAGYNIFGTGTYTVNGGDIYPESAKFFVDGATWGNVNGTFLHSNAETGPRDGLVVKGGAYANTISVKTFDIRGVPINVVNGTDNLFHDLHVDFGTQTGITPYAVVETAPSSNNLYGPIAIRGLPLTGIYSLGGATPKQVAQANINTGFSVVQSMAGISSSAVIQGTVLNGTALQASSASAVGSTNIAVGRDAGSGNSGVDAVFFATGTATGFFSGTVQGDTGIRSVTNLWIGAGGSGAPVPAIKISTLGATSLVQLGTGIIHSSSVGLLSSSAVVSADLNITTTSCTNQFVSAISSGGVGTCSSPTDAEIPLTNTHILVGNGSNVAVDVAMSGDATIANTGAVTLASTITAGGPTGSATVAPIVTYDAKGRLTTVSSATITPAVGSITGLGTGVATALGVNVGSAGAFVVNGGALGTPSSGTLTNATGLPTTGLTGTLQAAQEPAHTGDVTNSAGSLAMTIANAAVSYAKIANLGALAVMGRSANTSGVGADIQATAASDAVLRESGSTIGFGTIATGGIAANAVTLAKLATQATNTVLGNATSGTAVPTALAVGTCSTAASALIWTTNTGFGCNTSITAAAVPASGLTGATLAAGVTASSLTSLGTITSLTATTINAFTLGGTIAGGGNQLNNIVIGTTTPLAGSFTTVAASTSVTSPLLIGGSGTTQTLTYKTTTGTGATGADHIFVVGTNGATEAMRILNSASIGIGATDPKKLLEVRGPLTSAVIYPLRVTNPNLANDTSVGSGIQLATSTDSDNTHKWVAVVGVAQTAFANTMAMDFYTQQQGGSPTVDPTVAMRLGAGLCISPGCASNDPGAGGLRATGATIQFTALANAATTSAMCYNTGTGLLTYNSTVGTCTVSMLSAKNLRAPMTAEEGFNIVMGLTPWWYSLKEGQPTYTPGEQMGFVADYAVDTDRRLVALNDNEQPAGFRYEQYTAALTAAIKYLKADNDNLRADIEQLKRMVAR